MKNKNGEDVKIKERMGNVEMKTFLIFVQSVGSGTATGAQELTDQVFFSACCGGCCKSLSFFVLIFERFSD